LTSIVTEVALFGTGCAEERSRRWTVGIDVGGVAMPPEVSFAVFAGSSCRAVGAIAGEAGKVAADSLFGAKLSYCLFACRGAVGVHEAGWGDDFPDASLAGRRRQTASVGPIFTDQPLAIVRTGALRSRKFLIGARIEKRPIGDGYIRPIEDGCIVGLGPRFVGASDRRQAGHEPQAK